MAEAVLFDLATTLLQKLGDAALQEAATSCFGARSDLENLEETIRTLKAVLLDAEKQQESDLSVKEWLRRLRNLLYDADDLFDDIATVSEQQKQMNQVCTFFSDLNPLLFNRSIAKRVKSISENLGRISSDMVRFNFLMRQGGGGGGGVGIRKGEETGSFVDAEAVIGRDDDKRAIMKMLLGPDGDEIVPGVVAVVGFGGLGKTTLAQLVYNDEDVGKHFELKGWASISDTVDKKLVPGKILEAVEKGSAASAHNLRLDEVQVRLRRATEGKKYLLVLDDVWNEDRGRWLDLRGLLSAGKPGSRILVTTRSMVVAGIMSTFAPSYQLRGLDEEKSWELFRRLAFKPGEEKGNPRLVDIGREIANKCANVPLAIRAVGGLLYTKDTEPEWLSIRDDKLLSLEQKGDTSILPVLKLSYDHLPSSLKHCFAYCSLFPKDIRISREFLICRWNAQGFIESPNGKHCVEVIGNEYFMELRRRSFFQDVMEYEDGSTCLFKMHDLMHDLAQQVAGEEIFVADIDNKDFKDGIRHISFDSCMESAWDIPSSLLGAKNLRSFLKYNSWVEYISLRNSTCENLFSSFTSLRTLDLTFLANATVPSSICQLKHLRYLNFYRSHITSLPDSITRLLNLQALVLKGCVLLKALPANLKKLLNLVHLNLRDCEALTWMPFGLERLTVLQTLTDFVVGEADSSSRRSSGPDVLEGLINLRGSLKIVYQKWDTNALPNLKGLQYLESLSITWKSGAVPFHDEIESLCFQLPLNLKLLVVLGYGGLSFPSTQMDESPSLLRNLVEIRIYNLKRCQYLPRFNQLPSLKVLRLAGLDVLEYIEHRGSSSNESSYSNSSMRGATSEEASLSFFPSLEELKLIYMPVLKGWSREVEAAAFGDSRDSFDKAIPCFPRLSKLTVKWCPQLSSIPLLPRLEHLVIVRVSGRQVLEQLAMIKTASSTQVSTASPSTSSSQMTRAPFKSLVLSHVDSLPMGVLAIVPFLECLEFRHCHRMVSIPEDISSLTQLQQLLLRNSRGMASLPGSLFNLASLQQLEISNCPTLIEKCEEPNGEYWPLIQRIPEVIIDWKWWDPEHP
ncbi:hypothetical protein Dimus_000246 [Dionaea muscipula]